MRAEAGVPGQAEQLCIQTTAIAAGEKYEGFQGQGRQKQSFFTVLDQRMLGTEHRDQRLAHQLDHTERVG
ncbi:hypothetical protein D3C76_1754460 [compost metagenome]